MILRVHIFLILSASSIITNLANPAQADDTPPSTPPSTTRSVFKPANESSVSEIKNSSIPWVIPDLIPTIKKFKKNVFEDLKKSPQVQKIWDLKSDRQTTRDVLFTILNKFLSDIGHPAPATLANIVSKSASLFNPLTPSILFKTDAVNFAEFLLSHGIKIDRSTSQRYVDFLSSALDKADLNDKVSIFQATLDGYVDFIQSFGFKIVEVIDVLFVLFSSEIIVLHDKKKY